jgi:tetratricopeptide (TPR) repeat protein
MSAHKQTAFLAICLIFALHGSVSGQPSDGKGKNPGDQNGPDAALIHKLIGQLGSTKYAEREAASKQLVTIGEPALDFLRKAIKSGQDLETRRRLEVLIDRIELTFLEQLVKGGVQQHQKKEYKKAAELFERALKIGLDRFGPKDGKAPEGDIPILTEVFLHSARNWKELAEYEKAARAYGSAVYYANYNREKRPQIEREWAEMAERLVSGWKDTVKAKTDNDPGLKKLVAKHPLLLLHSRRYAAGNYLQSAYSFLHETTQESKHRNDVQILFDNGLRDGKFYVNMVTNQLNRVADLGAVDFEIDPDVAKVAATWRGFDCQAVEGHVYLENVKDDRGNDFYVLFQAIAVEKDSKYFAFVWRRLPGGKTVKRQN